MSEAHKQPDRPSQRPDLLMPVSDEHALRQFEIEALRQITDNLRRLNDGQVEQGKVLHSIDTRLVRIESNSLDSAVKLLITKVDILEADKDRRAGALGFVAWLKDFGPWLLAIMMAIFAAIGWEHKA